MKSTRPDQARPDWDWMAHALTLARRGLGNVWPNPAVGCVIVAGNRVVGRGWTQAGGRPHAETQALAQAGALAKGATTYVTLEPCAHHGKTPPCATALIAAGVARVVVAVRDPDPRVSGSGIAMLQDAGIKVDEGVCADKAARLNRGFLLRVESGRPMVTLKLALSLDGRIATASGESRWITGPIARRAVHAMRATHDALMVGAGTARRDDPMLNVRGFGSVRQPVRIVASRRLDLPLKSQLASSIDQAPLWVLHGPKADPAPWKKLGAEAVQIEAENYRQLDADEMLSALGARGLTRVFCEGGGSLAASLLSADLVDELVVFNAGLALGAEGTPGIGALGLDRLGDAQRFSCVEERKLGPDILTVWHREAE